MNDTALRIDLAPGESVGALLQEPPRASAALVLAHGAGAGMTHPFLAAVAAGLAARAIATLRFQFPYMEAGRRRPDRPEAAQRAIRAAVAAATTRWKGLPLFAGGKSFGGRMASLAHADEPLAGVRGLVFLGFPLHPAGAPSRRRADHLAALRCPLLFIQGTRDALADPALLQTVIDELGAGATVRWVPDANHSFHVRRRSGRAEGEVMAQVLDDIATWICTVPSA